MPGGRPRGAVVKRRKGRGLVCGSIRRSSESSTTRHSNRHPQGGSLQLPQVNKQCVHTPSSFTAEWRRRSGPGCAATIRNLGRTLAHTPSARSVHTPYT
ncbi:unnamed protein product [Arctia plantaginis]|uniref:Uncharacterized protein n=1 Tax=Arctia plantaginis TaxID=874455 RepID=A0A8S0ZVU1_ARCPL|nr:unnamed protein product [Arctia plantaginis]